MDNRGGGSPDIKFIFNCLLVGSHVLLAAQVVNGVHLVAGQSALPGKIIHLAAETDVRPLNQAANINHLVNHLIAPFQILVG
jgi:hypothetical protein